MAVVDPPFLPWAAGLPWDTQHFPTSQSPRPMCKQGMDSDRAGSSDPSCEEPPNTKKPWLRFPQVLSSCIALHQWP